MKQTECIVNRPLPWWQQLIKVPSIQHLHLIVLVIRNLYSAREGTTDEPMHTHGAQPLDSDP